MTDKEIMEKLFAEIIALKKHLKDRVDDNIFIAGEMFILDYLHNFIESMQEEPVSEDLEEAAWVYYEKKQTAYATRIGIAWRICKFFHGWC